MSGSGRNVASTTKAWPGGVSRRASMMSPKGSRPCLRSSLTSTMISRAVRVISATGNPPPVLTPAAGETRRGAGESARPPRPSPLVPQRHQPRAFLASSDIISGLHGGSQTSRTETEPTSSTCSETTRGMTCWKYELRGHAGVVIVIRTSTWPWSIFTSYTSPRSTMFTPSSGSSTLLRAVQIRCVSISTAVTPSPGPRSRAILPKGLLVGVPCAQGTLRGMTASARGAIMAVLGEGIAMKQTYTISEKLQQLFVIFVPIFVTQAALAGIQVLDAMMSGRFSARDLAGVAIGGNIWAPVVNGVGGILLAVTPIVAQHLGAGRKQEVSATVLQGLYLSLVLCGVLVAAGATGLPLLLGAMDLEPEVRAIAHRYLIALSWGLVPALAYNVLRCFFDALGLTRVTMAIALIGLPV